jgi:hypothetical protein
MPNETDWIDELYAEGADQQPPEALDAAILSSARRAVRPWYRRPRALASLATAASLVLAAMVVVLAPPEQAPEVPGAASEPAAEEQFRPERRMEVVEQEVVPMDYELRDAPGAREADAPAAPEPAGAGRFAAPAAAPSSPAATQPGSADDEGTAALEKQPPQDRLGSDQSAIATEAARQDEILRRRAATSAELQSGGWSLASPAPARCGELPGTETTRRFGRDATGVYLVVNEADRISYWRCQTDHWSEVERPAAEAADSGQQQPDTGDDQ